MKCPLAYRNSRELAQRQQKFFSVISLQLLTVTSARLQLPAMDELLGSSAPLVGQSYPTVHISVDSVDIHSMLQSDSTGERTRRNPLPVRHLLTIPLLILKLLSAVAMC